MKECIINKNYISMLTRDLKRSHTPAHKRMTEVTLNGEKREG